MALSVIGCWVLFITARHAVDGFEDDFGFHLGIAPPVTSLYPVATQLAFAPAELARAMLPASPKRRRKAGSKPPMLPANLDVGDLNPRPASQPQPGHSEESKTSQSDQSQIPPVA
ncbi:MAG TPA: hypothetical protein VIM71_03770 [Lacunisphaera sp.]